MMVGVLGPLAIVLALFAYVQSNLHRGMLLDVATRTATDLGNVIEGSLQHAMLTENRTEIQISIDNITANAQVTNLMLLNTESEVQAAGSQELLGRQFTKADVGCASCHASGEQHVGQRSIVLTLPDAGRVLRNCNPIENTETCYQCHDPTQPYNGILITDLNLAELEQHVAGDVERTLLLLSGALLLGAVLLGVTMERAVIEPLGRLTQVIRDFDRGDLSRRVHIDSGDEVGELAEAFNRMADGLEIKAKLEQKVRERTAELQVLYEELQEKEALREQLLKQVINAQEEERKRVARELHDELAQTLTGLLMSLDTAEDVLGPELGVVQGQLSHTRDITQRALEQTRGLILDLRPTMLDDLGLLPAIRWYVESHLEAAGILVTVRTEGEQRRLSPQTETALFRITQEAINNVVKHAQANRVNIALTWKPDEVIVRIVDNGRGFEPDAMVDRRDEARGMGLLGMKERASLLGGQLDIVSELGQGTLVVARLPTHERVLADVIDTGADR